MLMLLMQQRSGREMNANERLHQPNPARHEWCLGRFVCGGSGSL